MRPCRISSKSSCYPPRRAKRIRSLSLDVQNSKLYLCWLFPARWRLLFSQVIEIWISSLSEVCPGLNGAISVANIKALMRLLQAVSQTGGFWFHVNFVSLNDYNNNSNDYFSFLSTIFQDLAILILFPSKSRRVNMRIYATNKNNKFPFYGTPCILCWYLPVDFLMASCDNSQVNSFFRGKWETSQVLSWPDHCYTRQNNEDSAMPGEM